MKKLAGLLAFAVALAGAILLTQYYSRRYAPPPPPPPPAAAPAPPAPGSGSATLTPPPGAIYTDARGNAPVSLKTQYARLDLAAGKGYVTLALERDPARPAPASLWVWAYFFSPDTPGRYCAGDPVEVRQPFASAGGPRRGQGRVARARLPRAALAVLDLLRARQPLRRVGLRRAPHRAAHQLRRVAGVARRRGRAKMKCSSQ